MDSSDKCTSYTIELYENQDMTFEGTPKTYEGITDNTYTVEGYWVKLNIQQESEP